MDHKSIKRHARIILHLISVAMHKTFVLYSRSKQRDHQRITYSQFQQSGIESLASDLRTGRLLKNSRKFKFNRKQINVEPNCQLDR